MIMPCTALAAPSEAHIVVVPNSAAQERVMLELREALLVGGCVRELNLGICHSMH